MRVASRVLIFVLFSMAWFQPGRPYVIRGKALPAQVMLIRAAQRTHRSYVAPILAKKSNIDVVGPEFSRIINVAQISPLKSTSCRLLAKPEERAGLARRFDVPDIAYFASNVTLARTEEYSVRITGTFEGRVNYGKLSGMETITGEFETLLLNNAEGSSSGMRIDDAEDYDDEVGAGGNIDIGEISAQYFSLELS